MPRGSLHKFTALWQLSKSSYLRCYRVPKISMSQGTTPDQTIFDRWLDANSHWSKAVPNYGKLKKEGFIIIFADAHYDYRHMTHGPLGSTQSTRTPRTVKVGSADDLTSFTSLARFERSRTIAVCNHNYHTMLAAFFVRRVFDSHRTVHRYHHIRSKHYRRHFRCYGYSSRPSIRGKFLGRSCFQIEMMAG